MLCQPGRQVGWTIEIKLRLAQGLQLLQRQRLDAGGGDISEGAATAVELAFVKAQRSR